MEMAGLKGLLRWLRYESGFTVPPEPAEAPHANTSLSCTVFSGTSQQWVTYLNTSREARYDPYLRVRVIVDPQLQQVLFAGENDPSRTLAEQLTDALQHVLRALGDKPAAAHALRQTLFENPSNLTGQLFLRVSPQLPCDASREVAWGVREEEPVTNLVVRQTLLKTIARSLSRTGDKHHPLRQLGVAWPLLRRVISQLGFPNSPRDRFVEKIERTVADCLIAVNLLYTGTRHQQLVPNEAGKLFQRYVARRDDVPEGELFERHPYFRLLNELSFMLDPDAYARHVPFARVLVREFLDDRYLRLSLAGVMPSVDETMMAMPFHWHKRKVSTPYPRLGRYGILDQEDLDAWKKVESPFRDMGFVLLRQLGIGQFGRVYEAINQYNPHIPGRVALKIDRIVRGKKKEAIQNAEATMRIGEALATAPHVIRVFDAGKLRGKRFTYHVLQLVDGETLDNLVGISGTEHSSMLRPRGGQRSVREVQHDYLKTIKASTQEIWRRQRMTKPFTDQLNLSQTLDLLTSILLWLEEVHQRDFAVNDLKNGNLMVSRRGQLKGIDLDAYSPITGTPDRVTDFFFLAISLTLLLLNLAQPTVQPLTGCEGLLQSRDALRDAIENSWAFGDVGAISHGRVATADVIELLTELIEHSRSQVYALAPDRFSTDINRLIQLKRTVFATEIVLD